MYSRKDFAVSAIILIVSFAIFRVSPVHEIMDSRYEMLFTEQLLRNHSFSLDAHAFPELKSHKPGQVHRFLIDMPYQLVQMGERFYHYYPPGSAILSAPYVALANVFGLSATDPNGVYDLKGDKRIQAGLASVLMAVLSMIVYLTSRLILPPNWSLII